MSRLHVGWAGLLFGVLLAGCTSDGTDDAIGLDDVPNTTPGTDAEYSIAFDSPDADDFDKLLAAADNLIDVEIAEILNVEIEDEHRLVLSFEMESHHCFGVQSTAAETENEVILNLLVGRQAEVAPHSCGYGIFPYTTEVSLAAPLGDRTLVVAEPSEPDARGVAAVAAEAAGAETVDAPPTSTPAQLPANDTEWLLGSNVEDGVEWAINNGYEWRVLSFDGNDIEGVADGLDDMAWIGFRVQADLIVAYEWH